jgi:hypothetical protein
MFAYLFGGVLMAQVTIVGVFMGANVKTSNFDGVEKSALYIDLYQPDSDAAEKAVQIKSDNLGLINQLQAFKVGQSFKCDASVNAYKNKAYYKLVKLIA